MAAHHDAKSPYPNVLIVGGTGGLGENIVRGFLQPRYRGVFHTHVLVRPDSLANASKKALIDDYAEAGAIIRFGDLKDAANAKAATHGIDAVISAVSGSDLVSSQLTLIQGAKESGVKRIFPSEWGFDWTVYDAKDYPTAVFKWKAMVKEAAVKAGLEWTVVVNGLFNSYATGPLPGVDMKAGAIRQVGGPATSLALTSRVDIGNLTPEILLHPSSRNAVVHIAGDRLSLEQLAKHIEAASGKKLERSVQTVEQLRAAQAAHKEHEFPHIMAGLSLTIAQGKADQDLARSFNKLHVPWYRTQTVVEYLHSALPVAARTTGTAGAH